MRCQAMPPPGTSYLCNQPAGSTHVRQDRSDCYLHLSARFHEHNFMNSDQTNWTMPHLISQAGYLFGAGEPQTPSIPTSCPFLPRHHVASHQPTTTALYRYNSGINSGRTDRKRASVCALRYQSGQIGTGHLRTASICSVDGVSSLALSMPGAQYRCFSLVGHATMCLFIVLSMRHTHG